MRKKKEIILEDPKQNIDYVLRYRGAWKGSWIMRHPRLLKILLVI
jgi:predicted small secreted protein